MTRNASDQTIVTTTARTKQRTSSGDVTGADFFANGQSFLKRLQKNNNKEWFHANKSEYEQNIKQPAKLFADQLTRLLADATGQRLQAKIFRINRDLRFSTDKSPYKTYIHMLFAASMQGAKPAAGAFFFGLETDRIVFGGGRFDLEKASLQRYLEAVDDPRAGPALVKILKSLAAKGATLDEPALKKVPRAYAADHPRADLLRRKSITVWRSHPDMTSLSTKDPVKACVRELKSFAPLLAWLDTYVS